MGPYRTSSAERPRFALLKSPGDRAFWNACLMWAANRQGPFETSLSDFYQLAISLASIRTGDVNDKRATSVAGHADLAGHRPGAGRWRFRRNVACRQGGRRGWSLLRRLALRSGACVVCGVSAIMLLYAAGVSIWTACAFGCLTAMAGADVAIGLYERWAAKRIGVCEPPSRDSHSDQP